MIINPSSNTMISRRNSFRKTVIGRRRGTQTLSFPGGKLLWQETSKVLAGAVVFLCMTSFFISASITRVTGGIEKMETTYSELVDSNIVLRAQRARLFSPGEVEVLAGNQLSIHPPGDGQYHRF